MTTKKLKVSYRDKATNQNVSLGEIEAPRFDSVEEAVQHFSQGGEDGNKIALAHIHTSNDIDLQAKFRQANRPDRTKTQSLTSKFKALTVEQQLEALKSAGIEIPE